MNWSHFKPRRENLVFPSDAQAIMFWMSRAGLRRVPALVDLNELARRLGGAA
jgi:hypothetical protein